MIFLSFSTNDVSFLNQWRLKSSHCFSFLIVSLFLTSMTSCILCCVVKVEFTINEKWFDSSNAVNFIFKRASSYTNIQSFALDEIYEKRLTWISISTRRKHYHSSLLHLIFVALELENSFSFPAKKHFKESTSCTQLTWI